MPEVTPPETPATVTTTPVAAPAPPAPAAVTVSGEEYQALLATRTKLAQIEADGKKALETAEAARLKAMADKGDTEKALNTLRESKDREIKTATERANGLEAERLADVRGATISKALVGVDWVSPRAGAAATESLEARFEAIRGADGKIVVVEKVTRRPAADAIKDWLASEDSAFYRKASTQGGAGASGGERTTATTTAGEPAKTYQEWQNRIFGPAAQNTGPFGLAAIRKN